MKKEISMRIRSYEIHPPKNEEEFEDMCCSLFSFHFNAEFERNGRKGQKQNGVDVYGKVDGAWYGIQCKKRKHGNNLSIREIDGEIKQAKDFKPPLKKLIIATTSSRDEKTQEYIRKINDKNNLNFEVMIYFWEKISDLLHRFPDVHRKFYPEYFQKEAPTYSEPNTMDEYAGFKVLLEKEKGNGEIEAIVKLLSNNQPKIALELLKNLKTRVWNTADREMKYKITANQGSAYFAMGKSKKAGRLAIEALKYKEEDDSVAMINAANGYLFLNQKDMAQKICDECIEKYPSCEDIYSIRIHIESEKRPASELIDVIPSEFQKNSFLLRVLSYVAMGKGATGEAAKWAAESTKEPSAKNDHYTMANYASILLFQAKENASEKALRIAAEEDQEQVKEAREILSDLIDEHKGIIDYNPKWFAALIMAETLLGNREAALDILQNYLEKFQEDENIKNQAVSFFAEEGSTNEAISHLKNTTAFKNGEPRTLVFLSSLLLQDKKYFKELEKTLASIFEVEELDEEIFIEAKRIEARYFMENSNFSNAESVLKQSSQKYPKNISVILGFAELYRRMGKNDDNEINMLEKAYKCINNKTVPSLIHILAEQMYHKKKWGKARNLYERLKGESQYHPCIDKLKDCYYYLGEIDKAIALCQLILQKNKGDFFATELLSQIYEELGDLKKAKEICLKFLEPKPEHPRICLRLAIVAHRDNDKNLLKDIMSKKLDTSFFTPEEIFHYSHHMLYAGNFKRSIEIQYAGLVKHKDNPVSHTDFLQISIALEKHGDNSFLFLDTVQINTMVTVQMDEDIQSFVITEESENLFEIEITPEDTFAQKILGKKKGDEFQINKGFQMVTVTILDIKHKYLAALHESMNNSSKRFPLETVIEPFEIPREADAPLPEKLKNHLKTTGKSRKNVNVIFGFYKNKEITIGGIAELIKKPYAEIYNYLSISRENKLIMSSGNLEESNSCFNSIVKAKGIVMELSALITIHRLKIQDKVVQAFDDILITQTTIDEIRRFIDDLFMHQDSGKTVASLEQEKLQLSIIEKEEVRRNLNFYKEILQWTDNNCKKTPIPTKRIISQEKRVNMHDCFGHSSFDSMITSELPNRVLFSDDYNLRFFAKNDFKNNKVNLFIIGFGNTSTEKNNF